MKKINNFLLILLNVVLTILLYIFCFGIQGDFGVWLGGFFGANIILTLGLIIRIFRRFKVRWWLIFHWIFTIITYSGRIWRLLSIEG